jgi:protein-tyrosine phosphatase
VLKRAEEYTDIHSHLLWGTDNGAADPEESLAMVQKCGKAGIVRVIATPHFSSELDTVSDFVKRREIAYVSLMKELMQRGIRTEIIKAAEVLLTKETPKLAELERLAVNGTDKILIELPYTYWGDWVYNALDEIKEKRGLTPIIAHVERYPAAFTEKIYASSYPLQADASSFAKRRDAKELSEWIKNGRICFIGSNAHGAEDGAYENFKKAMKNVLSLKPDFVKRADELLGL